MQTNMHQDNIDRMQQHLTKVYLTDKMKVYIYFKIQSLIYMDKIVENSLTFVKNEYN